MSGYFDALIRSSGMAIGRARSASAQVEPAAMEVDVDRNTTDREEGAVRAELTPHRPLAPLYTPDTAQLTVPQVPIRVERHTHEEPDAASAPVRGATETAVHSPEKPSTPPVQSPEPELDHSLVRAAMRWVAAGDPQVSPTGAVNPANLIDEIAQSVQRPQQSRSAVPEHTSTIATKRLNRDDDDAMSDSQNEAHPPATLGLTVEKSIAATALPIRASAVAPAPLPRLARDEVVEVSIGAIHVRVDAPPAQTIARPALTPAAGTPGAATTRPARSALSRRALRRI
jgi:hypothetical protein